MIKRGDVAVVLDKLLKYVVEEESILSAVLKGHLIMDREIESLLTTVLVEPSVLNLERLYLPQKVDLLVALGVISKDDGIPYKKFNNIRSKFAHDLDYKINEKDVDTLKDSLTPKQLVFLPKDIFIKAKGDIETRLIALMLPLLFLIIIQHATDDILGKKTIEPISNKDINQYMKIANDNLKLEYAQLKKKC